MSDRAGKICGRKGSAGANKRFAALAVSALALSLGACSALPDETRPGFIYGSEGPAKATTTSKDFPNLADVPDQAPASTPPAERQKIAANLSTDRAQAQLADTTLRSGSGEVVVASGSAAPGAAEHPMQAPEVTPVEEATPPAPVPSSAPAPRAVPENTPMSEAPAASEEQVADMQPQPEPEAAPQRVAAAAPAPREEPAAAAPVRSAASERTAALAPSLSAGTEATSSSAPQEVPAPKLAAVEPSPVLTPPPSAEPVPTGSVIPFPSRGGHARITDIKGGIQLSEIGGSGDRPEITSEDDQGSDTQITPAPTTPVEVKPAE